MASGRPPSNAKAELAKTLVAGEARPPSVKRLNRARPESEARQIQWHLDEIPEALIWIKG